MSHRFGVVFTAVLAISMAGCASSAASPTLTTPAPTGGARPTGAAPSAPSTAGATARAGGSTAGASGSACGLVTVDEVTLASGQPMAVSGDAGIICTFSSVADPSFVVYVQIYNDKPSMALMMQLEASGSEDVDNLVRCYRPSAPERRPQLLPTLLARLLATRVALRRETRPRATATPVQPE